MNSSMSFLMRTNLGKDVFEFLFLDISFCLPPLLEEMIHFDIQIS